MNETPRKPEDSSISLNLTHNEIFWLASCHMFAVMVADSRVPSAVSEAYKILTQNARDLGTEGINNLYQRMSMLVQAKWPDSTQFVFPDPTEAPSSLHGANPRSQE